MLAETLTPQPSLWAYGAPLYYCVMFAIFHMWERLHHKYRGGSVGTDMCVGSVKAFGNLIVSRVNHRQGGRQPAASAIICRNEL